MEQKLVRVSFNVEMAKKITNKEIEGKIVDNHGNYYRIVCFDLLDDKGRIIGLRKNDNYTEKALTFDDNGCCVQIPICVLMLEIPEYLTFKYGDIIAFGDKFTFIGIFKSVWTYNESHSDYVVLSHENRLMFDGDAWTYKNARLASEEEKQRLIDALKASKEPKAKEYLKCFFGIEEKRECEFKPKDWVLCYSDGWNLCQFSHTKLCDLDNKLMYVTVGGIAYEKCIPYNEQTAHLLGTTDDWEG